MSKDSTKLPGKAEYAGRRRRMTRTSGFRSHPESTGGGWDEIEVPLIEPHAGVLEMVFAVPRTEDADFGGYGCWFSYDGDMVVTVEGGRGRVTLTNYGPGSWNKLGSFWVWDDDEPHAIVFVRFEWSEASQARIAIHQAECGSVEHDYLADAPAKLLRNQHMFAPETNFLTLTDQGTAELSEHDITNASRCLVRKTCNRCARLLPVNIANERHHLSFSNHCVAAHRLPCGHTGFGKLRHVDTGQELHLHHGFQLECRFCKKFAVNAALNPQRTAAQMKEDGARRRALELLLSELYDGTPQLRYRHLVGRELVDDVWRIFGGRCFKCNVKLASKRSMHLDHTRPLKLLWPLDGSATALCGPCNSEKRDRAPVDFYSGEELALLSAKTGLAIQLLEDPRPNEEALQYLLDRRGWFFDVFLQRDEMTKVRDGKVTGELVVKALQKVVALSRFEGAVDLEADFRGRRR